MWEFETDKEINRKLKSFRKRHNRELTNMLDNLDTLLTTLERGGGIEQVKRLLPFVHGNYRKGLLSIDPRGKGAHLKATRMYVYPDENEQKLYRLTVGDKQSQPADVQFGEQWIEDHLRGKGEADSDKSKRE